MNLRQSCMKLTYILNRFRISHYQRDFDFRIPQDLELSRLSNAIAMVETQILQSSLLEELLLEKHDGPTRSLQAAG